MCESIEQVCTFRALPFGKSFFFYLVAELTTVRYIQIILKLLHLSQIGNDVTFFLIETRERWTLGTD